jgi:hypothetical protein
MFFPPSDDASEAPTRSSGKVVSDVGVPSLDTVESLDTMESPDSIESLESLGFTSTPKQAKKNKKKRSLSFLRGSSCENHVREFLLASSIVFWQNVTIRRTDCDTEFDFILPGGSIECKYKTTSCKNTKFLSQLKKQLKINKGFLLIYFMHSTPESISTLEKFFSKEIPEYSRVHIISNLESILDFVKMKFSYVFGTKNIFYPFISDEKNKGSRCFISKENFNKLALIVDDKTEQQILEDFSVTISEVDHIGRDVLNTHFLSTLRKIKDLTGTPTVIFRKKLANTNIQVYSLDLIEYMFEIFHSVIVPDNDFTSNKYPKKIIDGISIRCVCDAHNVFYNPKLIDHCHLNKRARLENVGEE